MAVRTWQARVRYLFETVSAEQHHAEVPAVSKPVALQRAVRPAHVRRGIAVMRRWKEAVPPARATRPEPEPSVLPSRRSGLHSEARPAVETRPPPLPQMACSSPMRAAPPPTPSAGALPLFPPPLPEGDAGVAGGVFWPGSAVLPGACAGAGPESEALAECPAPSVTMAESVGVALPARWAACFSSSGQTIRCSHGSDWSSILGRSLSLQP